MLKLKLFTLTVLAVSLYLPCTVVTQAAPDYRAIYSPGEGKLYLPYVLSPSLGETIYEVEMQQLPGSNPLQFIVTKAQELSEKPTATPTANLDFTVIAQNNQFHGYQYQGIAEGQLFTVIRNQEYLKSLYSELFAGASGYDPLGNKIGKFQLPKVDFTQEMVIVVLLGAQLAGRTAVSVERLTETPQVIEVTVKLQIFPYQPPPQEAPFTATLAQPYQLIKLKKSQKIVTFNILQSGEDSSNSEFNTEEILRIEKRNYERIPIRLYQKFGETEEATAIPNIAVEIGGFNLNPIDKSQFASLTEIQNSKAYQENLQIVHDALVHLRDLLMERLQIDVPEDSVGASNASSARIWLELTPKQILAVSRWEEPVGLSYSGGTEYELDGYPSLPDE